VCSFLLLDDLDGLDATSDEAGSASGNQTDLLASWGVSWHSGWVTNVLMVTTTMRMLNGVHCNTSNSWPLELLGVILEVSVVGLQKWLVSSLATSDDADPASAGSLDGSADA